MGTCCNFRKFQVVEDDLKLFCDVFHSNLTVRCYHNIKHINYKISFGQKVRSISNQGWIYWATRHHEHQWHQLFQPLVLLVENTLLITIGITFNLKMYFTYWGFIWCRGLKTYMANWCFHWTSGVLVIVLNRRASKSEVVALYTNLRATCYVLSSWMECPVPIWYNTRE